ncbi:MAG: T9SS type A sorting domain-containing protein [Flavobacteriales bacterium]|nr:T9SS type A sorting domain-containing protein [Flavobacteriales bacterium]
MKQSLLILGLVAGVYSQAQLTTANMLSNGDMRSYYSLDSSASNLASVTGTDVTWDYSNIGGYMMTPNDLNVIDASASAFASDFPSTSLCEEFNNGVQTFFNNVGDDVIVDGFVYQEAGNDFVVRYETDDLIALALPMNVSESYTDAVDGVAIIPLAGTVNIDGDATVTCDGSGTLNIGSNTYTNVIRIHTLEETSGNALGQDILITRESFVYYDLDDANPLPIVRHDRVEADLDAGGTYGFQAMYSKDAVTDYVGVEEGETTTLSVYPNPATDVLSISFEGTAQELSIFNAAGQVVYTSTAVQNLETIDVSAFDAGIYMVQIRTENGLKTEKVTVK